MQHVFHTKFGCSSFDVTLLKYFFMQMNQDVGFPRSLQLFSVLITQPGVADELRHVNRGVLLWSDITEGKRMNPSTPSAFGKPKRNRIHAGCKEGDVGLALNERIVAWDRSNMAVRICQ